MEPQSHKNTIITISGNGITSKYRAILEMSRPSVSYADDQRYNYRKDSLPIGGGRPELSNITAVWAEYEYDRFRRDLGLFDAATNQYYEDISIVPFEITYDIYPSDVVDDAAVNMYTKKIQLKGCRLSGAEPTSVAIDNTLYTVSTTISVQTMVETRGTNPPADFNDIGYTEA